MNSDKLKVIKSLADQSDHLDMSSFQFINLEMVKKETGSSWAEMHKKIFNVSEYFLEKRIEENDILLRLQDGFLVVFADLSQEQAIAHGHELSQELNRFFLGEESLKKIEIVSRHERLDIDTLMNKFAILEPNTHEHIIAADLNESLDWKFNPVDNLELVYRPIWDSQREIISSYSCIPRVKADGFTHYDRNILLGNVDASVVNAMDMKMLHLAQEQFSRSLALSIRAVLTIAVSYKTLNNKLMRLAYFKKLAEIPKPLRKYFYICVDQVPVGVPQFKLEGYFRSLKNLCGATLVHNLPANIRVQSFKGCSISLFGFAIDHYLNKDKGLTKAHLDEVQFYCNSVHKLKTAVYVTSLENPEHILHLKRAGVQFFSGICVGKQKKAPEPLTTLSTISILKAQTALKEGK